MLFILSFTILGFLAGLIHVMIKRKIKPGALLTAAFLTFATTAIYKIYKDIQRKKKGFYF